MSLRLIHLRAILVSFEACSEAKDRQVLTGTAGREASCVDTEQVFAEVAILTDFCERC